MVLRHTQANRSCHRQGGVESVGQATDKHRQPTLCFFRKCAKKMTAKATFMRWLLSHTDEEVLFTCRCEENFTISHHYWKRQQYGAFV